MQKSEVFIEVTPESLPKYVEVIKECGDRFIEPGAGGRLLFKQRGHGILEYMPFQGWTITQTFIPDSGVRNNFSPEDLKKFLTIKEEMEIITGELRKGDIYIKVDEKTLGGYRNVLESMGEGIAFCSTDFGYLTYTGSNWYVILGLPKTNHSNNWSPQDLKDFLVGDMNKKAEVQHPVGPEDCFKPDYEIHLNPFWDMGSESMKPGQVIHITEDQFKIIELFANTKKDENLNTIYVLNDVSFHIFVK